MAKLDLNPEEFADYISALMFDKIINNEEVISNNDDFSDLMDDLKGSGAKSKLMRYYLDMPSSMRMKYKWTRDTLTGDSDQIHTIRIMPEVKKKKEKEKEGLAKRAIRKIKKSVGLGDSVRFTEEEANLLEEIINEGEK